MNGSGSDEIKEFVFSRSVTHCCNISNSHFTVVSSYVRLGSTVLEMMIQAGSDVRSFDHRANVMALQVLLQCT
jgi:hypothetical protein